MSDTRFLPCEACEGSGRRIEWVPDTHTDPGYYEPGNERCPVCDDGLEEVEVEAVREDEIMEEV